MSSRTATTNSSKPSSVSSRLINSQTTSSKVQQQSNSTSRVQQPRSTSTTAAAMAELKYTVRNMPVPVRYNPSTAVQQPQPRVMLQPPFPTSDRPRMRSHQAYQPPPQQPSEPDGWSNCSSPQRARLPSSNSSTGTAEPLPVVESPAATPTPAAPLRKLSAEEISLAEYNVPQLTELLQFSSEHGLALPTVKLVARPGKRANYRCLYDCSIKLEDRAYQSYPRDCRTREEAVAEAAQPALADLRARYARQSKLLLSTERDIVARMPPIIEQHYHGIWADQVALDYEDMYVEQLPPNWLALLDTLPNISVEPTLVNKCVLKHCAVNEKHNSMNGSTKLTSGLASDISVPSNTTRLDDTGFTVEITYAASTIEVWCRQLDTDDANRYNLLIDRMTEYYAQPPGEHAVSVNVGGFYVVRYGDGWYRVRALKLGKHDVTFFLIDYGEELLIPRCDIFVLKREFAREPAQAFVCRLVGLEELVNMSCVNTHLETITGRQYVARAHQDSAMDAVPIVLYDVDEHTGPCNVNQLLMQQIVTDSVVSSLDTTRINNVYCTHTENNGDVYVQVQSEGFDKLMALIETYEQIDFAHEPDVHVQQISAQDVRDGTLYLKRWTRDGQYYRCVVNDLSPGGDYAQLYFVDYGGTEIVRLANGSSAELYLLERISDVLCAFPHQAFRVRIDIDAVYIGSDFAERALQLMPPDRPVLLKVLREMETEGQPGTVPICEMFRRSESASGGLFSVNASLMWGSSAGAAGAGDGNNNTTSANISAPSTPVTGHAPTGLGGAAGDGEDQMSKLTRKLERLKSVSSMVEESNNISEPVPSTGELPTPELPAPNSFLDVRIPSAVSPWNFFVQPYHTACDLSHLMEKLQARYNTQATTPVNMEDVVPGRIYASRRKDGIWYRTSVIKIIHSGSISVFYCDFGYYANLTVKQLMHLDDEYKQLPYQAMKARLAGVAPTNAKWTMHDCKYFENLVRDRTFVSVLVDLQKDELYKCDVVLNLRLYDTSTNNDVEIDKLLIQEGIAKAEANT
ncbi:tapas [Carabus blaptoides fortunei]